MNVNLGLVFGLMIGGAGLVQNNSLLATAGSLATAGIWAKRENEQQLNTLRADNQQRLQALKTEVTSQLHQLKVDYNLTIDALSKGSENLIRQAVGEARDAFQNDTRQLNDRISENDREIQNLGYLLATHAQDILFLRSSDRVVIDGFQKLQIRQKTLEGNLEKLVKAAGEDKKDNDDKVLPLTNKNLQIVPDIKPATYVCIDGNNLHHSCNDLKRRIDWVKFTNYLSELVDTEKFGLEYHTGFGSRTGNSQKRRLKKLGELNYKVVPYNISYRNGGKDKTLGDDVGITINLMKSVKAGDRVILVTGDGDFLPLLKELRARKVKVTIIGADGSTNKELKKAVGVKFISLDSIADKIFIANQTA